MKSCSQEGGSVQFSRKVMIIIIENGFSMKGDFQGQAHMTENQDKLNYNWANIINGLHFKKNGPGLQKDQYWKSGIAIPGKSNGKHKKTILL